MKRPRDTRGTMDTRDTTRQKTTGDATRHARDLEKMGPLAGTFHECQNAENFGGTNQLSAHLQVRQILCPGLSETPLSQDL